MSRHEPPAVGTPLVRLVVVCLVLFPVGLGSLVDGGWEAAGWTERAICLLVFTFGTFVLLRSFSELGCASSRGLAKGQAGGVLFAGILMLFVSAGPVLEGTHAINKTLGLMVALFGAVLLAIATFGIVQRSGRPRR